jgi:hypothetical protein
MDGISLVISPILTGLAMAIMVPWCAGEGAYRFPSKAFDSGLYLRSQWRWCAFFF